jgi:hypothetical protein
MDGHRKSGDVHRILFHPGGLEKNSVYVPRFPYLSALVLPVTTNPDQ